MRTIGIVIILALVISGVGLAQPAAKTVAYTEGNSCFSALQLIEKDSTKTTDIFTWGWAGTMSIQVGVQGRDSRDSVIIYTYYRRGNKNARAWLKAGTDSLIGVDTLIGTAIGQPRQFSGACPATNYGQLWFVNIGPDSAKYFEAWPLFTPTR